MVQKDKIFQGRVNENQKLHMKKQSRLNKGSIRALNMWWRVVVPLTEMLKGGKHPRRSLVFIIFSPKSWCLSENI